ncbi:hypothetical protein HS088_TW03G00303 [Tripterygium wilfordii]|uniref:Uncharacterized protein n=1 Tax=Tripterygium wilfordii TaxID=458696 RepID=A0A7J7DUD7_TRIWF|nr:uncharacterized protein LOC119995192 [Tripterygium wilfordii]KAF5749975.1 hypothetical protein HS088_TW03G00303 [Tripterygium wilfordii]
MGNYISCTLSTPLPKHKHSSRSTKVILPSGEIKQFQAPVKAAELMLMLDMPSFFLVNSQSLKIGCRFSPLSADEDLELSNVYVMFPMKRLNSTVKAGDMAALFVTAKRVARAKVRVLPEAAGEVADHQVVEEVKMVPKLSLDDIEEFSKEEFMHRLSMTRSKKPLLETIVEEPICSR